MKGIELNIRSAKPEADWGAGEPLDCYRCVLVEADGAVLALDEVSGTYTRHHQLSAEQVAEAQRLAELVRSGTHYVAGGFVRAKREVSP